MCFKYCYTSEKGVGCNFLSKSVRSFCKADIVLISNNLSINSLTEYCSTNIWSILELWLCETAKSMVSRCGTIPKVNLLPVKLVPSTGKANYCKKAPWKQHYRPINIAFLTKVVIRWVPLISSRCIYWTRC